MPTSPGTSWERQPPLTACTSCWWRAPQSSPIPADCAQFAWFLATCPDSRHQDAVRARRLASSAVEQQPQDAVHWRVLAAAEYRGGNYQAALDALRQSAQLKQGQDGFDLLLLALCHARLGDHLQADEQYLAAMRWLDENPCDVELIAPLRQEASLLLPAADSPVTN